MTQKQVTDLVTNAGFNVIKTGKDGAYFCRKQSI